MKLQKWMIISFLTYSLSHIIIDLHYLEMPHWLTYFNWSAPWDYSYAIKDILHHAYNVFIIIAVIKLIIQKEIKMIKTLRFPILYFVLIQTFWFVFAMISTKFSLFSINGPATAWYVYPLFFLKFIVLGLIIAYYSKTPKPNTDADPKPVTKGARFLNYLIDSIIIFAFAMSNILGLSDGFIFEDIPYFNDSPYWYFFINLFAYYFVLEVLFLQTIGKLHNNSVVHYEGNRVVRILLRTFGRFIPFDAFSFFGSKGFHDSVSKTTVVLVDDLSNDKDVDHLIVS